ncbi:hypothetical protein [Asinibacterium sp. OR53]|uniref:hypothetical protein n=1 Tax=Asinibacterium sp. OR53 TaxID=925409 RepID=UPI00047A62C4|nr:hypothetical protein [Asinibacterium sp. OR53]
MKALLWGLFSVFVITAICTHIWTTIIAYQESGIGATFLTFILPGLSELYWMFKMFEDNTLYSTIALIHLVLSAFFGLTRNDH